MAGSLRDQLVQAGLATNAQAKKAERQQRAEEQSKRHGGNKQRKVSKGKGEDAPKTQSATAKVKSRAQKLETAKIEKDRAIASQRNEKSAAKALRAEIKQIILLNDQRAKTTKAAVDGYVPYSFVHGKKIKRIYVPAAQRDQLISGALVVVNNDGLYHFVDKKVADKIVTRDPRRIIVANADKPAENSTGNSDDDEHYAKFQVPDDLDW